MGEQLTPISDWEKKFWQLAGSLVHEVPSDGRAVTADDGGQILEDDTDRSKQGGTRSGAKQSRSAGSGSRCGDRNEKERQELRA